MVDETGSRNVRCNFSVPERSVTGRFRHVSRIDERERG